MYHKARKPELIFLGILLILSLIFLVHYYIVGQGVYGDGRYYFAYTRSIIKDYDLQFANEYGHHYSPKSNNTLTKEQIDLTTQRTKTGYVMNKYPIGISISWILPFAFADVVANGISFLVPTFPNNGYSDIYQISVGFINVLFVVAGLYVLYNFLNSFFNSNVSLLSILLLLFATNLLYYGSIDVINTHPLSFLLGSIFLAYWWNTRKNRKRREWFLLGFLSGLLAMTRTQDLIFLIIPVVDLLISIYKLGFKHILSNACYLIFGGFIGFLPQLFVWYVMYSSFISPYILGGEGFSFLKPHILELFLNTKTGLFIWTPLFIVIIIGYYHLYKKNRTLALYSMILFALQTFLISSWSGWSQGESFGVRMLLSTTPFLALGLGAYIEYVTHRINNRIILVLFCLFIIFNFLAIFYFLLIFQGNTFDLEEITQDRSINKFRIMLPF